MTLESKTPPPVDTPNTGDGVGIHLSYIRRDLDEMKRTHEKSHEEIKMTLQEIRDGHPTRGEFNELIVEVKELILKSDTIFTWKDTLTGKIWGIGFAITTFASLAAFVINYLFK